MVIIDGKKIASQILRRLGQQTIHRSFTLAVVQVGHRPDSDVYIRQKVRAAKIAGIQTQQFHCQTRASQASVAKLLRKLSADQKIQGILLQLPLPSHLDTDRLILDITPTKDVDGFHPAAKVISPLIQAIERCLPKYSAHASQVLLLGRPSIFSATLKKRLEDKKYSVVESSGSTLVPTISKKSDIIITVRGRGPKIQPRHLKRGAVVIDAGIRRYEHSISGDADPAIATVVSAYTPVPGGIGPLTVAYALQNLVRLSKK